MHTTSNRVSRFVAAICALAALPVLAFEAAPARQVGPTGTERTIGASIHGQGGWAVPTFDARFDQGISTDAAHSGSQSWRVSNWYSSGIVDAVRSPAFAPAAEGTANTLAFQDFWFRVPQANEGLLVSTSLTDASGRRMTYLEIRVANGAPRVMAVGVALGDNGTGTCGPARPLLCDAGVDYVSHESPVLAFDTWYRLRVSLSLHPSILDDSVDYRVFADDGAVFWQQLGMPSWEDLYYDSIYGSGQKVTVDRMQLRLAEDPDAAPGFLTRAYDTYGSTHQPAGLFIDDLAIGSATGAAQATSFEPAAGTGGLLRFVDPTGSDAANDCLNPGFPCRTLQHGIASADPGDTVELATGTYVGPFVVDKTLTLRRGPGGLAPELTIGSGGPEQTLLTVADATDVVIQGLTFDVDQSYVAEAIRTQGVASGLTINGNSFLSRQSVAGVRGGFGRRHAVAINLDRADTTLHGGAADITFSNNTCRGVEVTPTRPVYFRACLAADAIGGQISGNVLTGGYYDAIVRFSTSPVSISGNTFSGGGLQLSENNANGHTTVQGNTFDPDESRYAYLDNTNAPIFFGDPRLGPVAIMLKLQNTSGSDAPGLDISGNTFNDHAFAIHAQNVATMQLADNEFTPRAGLPDFLHLAISNKVVSSNSHSIAPRPLELTASGNTFLGESGTTKGTAVEFWNHHAAFAGVDAAYGSLQFSGNTFSGDLQRYMALDATTCASSAACSLPLFAQVAATAGSPGTPVAPFAGNLSALDNTFGGAPLDAGSTLGERALVELKVVHRPDNAVLGLVDLGIGSQSEVFVDDGFAGPHAHGAALPFEHTASAATEVYWQVNAFASLADAQAAVAAGGTVYVAAGTYAGVTINKHIALLGNDSEYDGIADAIPDTVIEGQLTLAAGGPNAASPLRIENLRVAHAADDDIAFTAPLSHVAISRVELTGTGGHGVDFGADASGLRFTDLRIVGTGRSVLRFGMLHHTSRDVSDVVIQRVSILDNDAGIVLNGGDSSGDARIEDWHVLDSTFIGNDTLDATIWGGGIWIKTAAEGSLIDGFEVANTLFQDNGSGGLYPPSVPLEDRRHLNRAGITVRARAGTTLRAVQLCGNTYRNTGAGGTQEVGVYVFDQATGSAGGEYQPVEICGSNTVEGLQEGVSGYEQFVTGNGRPAIALTGTVAVDGGTGWAHVDLGQQGALYVDDDFLVLPNGADATVDHPLPEVGPADVVIGRDGFATIAEALLNAASGASVFVMPGDYRESAGPGLVLSIDRPVNLIGAQAGIDARTRDDDAGASILRPGVNFPGMAATTLGELALLVIDSDNVSVDGFVFDADNPDITTGFAMGGADPDADSGVFVSGSNIGFAENVFRNFVGTGIYGFASSAEAHSGNQIRNNRFENFRAPSRWGIGVLVQDNWYAQIFLNRMEDVRLGVQTNNFHRADPAGNGGEIAGNELLTTRHGVFHNLFYGAASPFAISGNVVTAVENGLETARWSGIWVESMGGDATAALEYNVIDATAVSGRLAYGFELNNWTSSQSATTAISGGSITGADVGVLATDGTVYTGPVADARVQGVAFSGIGIASVLVEDTIEIAGGARVTLGDGNSFDPARPALALSGPLATAGLDGIPGVDHVLVRSAGSFLYGAPGFGGALTREPGSVANGMAAAIPGGVVELEQGTFSENIAVSKPLILRGPKHTLAGDGLQGLGEAPAARDGSGEAVISPAAGQALRINADHVTIEGLTFSGLDGDPNTVALGSGDNFGGGSQHVTVRNNRFVALLTTGLYTNGDAGTVANWLVEDNLFDGIGTATGGNPQSSAVNLWRANDSQVRFNTIRNVAFGGIQLIGAAGTTVHGNSISQTGRNGINIAFSTDVDVHRNSLSDTNTLEQSGEAGLTLYRDSTDIEFSCNLVAGGGHGDFAVSPDAAGALSDIRVFHNQFSAAEGPDLSNPAGTTLEVGSNRYGAGVDPTVSGLVAHARPLPATTDPLAHPLCGVNAPAELVVTGGSGQSAVIGQPFSDPLQVRLEDALDGAVSGAAISLAAQPGGASAGLVPASGTTDVDGMFASVATANLEVGSHSVTASATGVAPVAFSLTNTKGSGDVLWGTLEFNYDGEPHAVTATLAQEPSVACVVTPPTVGPEVGSYAVSAHCTGTNYDAIGVNTATVGGAQSVHVLPSDEYFTTVAAALADEDTTDDSIIELAPGTYSGAIVLTKGVHLRGGGITGLPAAMAKAHAGAGPHLPPATLVDGGGTAGTGITIASGVQGVEISGLEVTGFGGDCIYASQGNDGLVVRENVLHGCGGHGLQVNGIAGITSVVVEYNTVTDVGNRGIVVWNGAKRDILVRNNHIHGALDGFGNVVEGPFATAIAFEDGTATGITVVDNLIEDVGDAGITAVQLTSGSPSGTPNTIALNTIRNPGRFGIALMIPNGTGLFDGDGAILVEANTIQGGSNQGGYASDRAGISVVRRFFIGADQGQVDATMGVVVSSNSVLGFTGVGGTTGYGIVVEGVGHRVRHNDVSGNDVGLQLQQGNQPSSLPGSSDVDDTSTDFASYFDRGNAPLTCASLDSNDLAGNTAESSFLPATGASLTGSVHNQSGGSWHCTINEAIAAAQPGDLLRPLPGVYRERVLVDRRVHLAGPWAGFHGANPVRTGAGEAIIDPPELGTSAGTQAVRIAADDVILDGFTITGLHGGSRDAGVASGTNFGVLGNDAQIKNNRFLDLDGHGVYTNTATDGGNQPLSGWQVQDNLFEGVGTLGSSYSAVNLWKMVGAPGVPARVTGNVIRDIGFAGVQLVEGQHLEVSGNEIGNTGANGINVGPQLNGGVQVHHNTIGASNLHGWPTEAAIVLFGGSNGADVYCNTISTTGGGDEVFVAQAVGHVSGSLAPLGSGLRVFHNAITGPASVANGNSAAFVVGSNWYANGVTTGAVGGGLLVADGLDADPLLHTACGHNDPVTIEVFGGDGQTATAGQPFTLPLQARVEDALGGAVPGHAVRFEAPPSGASAVLSPASGTVQASDHNGVVAVDAVANAFTGGYAVTASGDAGSAAFPLHNLSQLQVLIDLNGPVGGIEVGDTVAYTGRITNQNPDVAENVVVRVVVSASTALDPADVAMCVVDPGNPALCHDIDFDDDGATLSFDFPDAIDIPGGFDISPSYDFTHQLRTVYGKAGVFTAAAQVVGVVSQTVYASDLIATEVVGQHAGITLALDGPVAGVEKGVATPYLARLTNTADHVADPVRVEFTVSRAGGMGAGDLTVEYDTGGGVYAILPLWFDDGGDADPSNDVLLGQFGPAGGFPLLSGHDATDAFRVTYHVAPHTFSVAATVVDASADSDGVPVYAADQLATDVIEASADVAMALSGPFDAADGTTLVAPRAGDTILLRGALANAGGPVPDLVQAAFTVSASFSDIAVGDLVASYWFVAPGAACVPAGARESVTFTDDGATLSAATTPQPLTEGMALDVCFELGLTRAGVYNIAAVIEDAVADTDGTSTYAGDNLAMAVAKGEALVTLDPLSLSAVFDGSPHAAVASTDPDGLTVLYSYDNSPEEPVQVGSYTVLATVDDPDFEGSTSGILVIAPADATLTVAGDTTGAVTVAGTPLYSHTSGTVGYGGTAAEPVRAFLTVSRPGGLLPTDLVLQYRTNVQEDGDCVADGGFWWCPLTLTANPDGTLETPFGPTSGFPLVDGAVSHFRTRYASGGRFHTSVRLDGVNSGQTYAIGAGTVEVAELALLPTGPANASTGTPVDTATTLANTGAAPLADGSGGPTDENVIGRFSVELDGDVLAPGELTVQYLAPDGLYHAIPLAPCGNGLCGAFGPSTGFPVAAGYLATSQFRTLFTRAGSYSVGTSVQGVESGAVFAQSLHAVTVAAGASTISIDPASLAQTYNGGAHPVVVTTDPPGLDYTVSYGGSASAPVGAGSYAVVAQITEPGFSGTAMGELVVAKAVVPVSINGAVGGVVERNHTGAPQAVTASTPAPITGTIAVSYDGSTAPPVAAGTYAVLAEIVDANYAGSASATLVVADAAAITLALDPLQEMAFADAITGYTAHVAVTGTIANAGPQTSQPVHTRISVVRVDDGNGEGGQPVAIALEDVQACVFDIEGYQNQAGDHQGCPENYQYLFAPSALGSRDGRPAVQFRYPNLPENDAVLGSTGGFPAPIPAGTLRFRTGEYRVYLDVVGVDGSVYASATTTSTSVPDASIAYSGPLSGPAEQLLLSQTTLRNQGGRSIENVLVRVTLSDAMGAALTTDDAELFYQLGGDYAELPLVELGGDLVTLYGPPGTGFALEDGHDATDAGAALFHRTGAYELRYEVLDAATLSTLFASEAIEFTIAANAASFTLADLLQTYDGASHPASVVASPAQATYSVAYAPFDGASCGAPLAGLPVDAGSYCVEVTATGSFSGGASGVLVIAPAAATVTLDPGSLSAVFDGAAHPAEATTVPADLPVAFTYDGSSEAPVNVGSYTVVATVTDPNYSGGTSGILTISPADATLTLDGDLTGAVVTAGSAPLYSMSSGTVGLSGPAPQESVRAFLTISRPGGILPSDLEIDYLSSFEESGACVPADGGGFWCPLPLGDAGDGTLGAAFGPGTGFPLVDGNASFFRTRYHRGGQYHTSVRLDGVDSLQTYAIGAGTVDVAELTLLQGGPATALTNSEVGTSSTLRNIGAAGLSATAGSGPTAENVIARFVVSHAEGALVPADLSLQYLAPDGSYQPLTLVPCGDALCGDFGPSTGFPVDAGYLATSLFRTVFSRTGGYLVETAIEGVDSGAVFVEASQAITVSSGNATIVIDPASLAATYDGGAHAVAVTTEPAGLTFEVSYDGGDTLPVDAGSYLVEATITDPDFTGSVTGTLVIAPKMVTIELTDLGPYTYDGSAHPATASIPGLVAGDSVDLLLSYNGGASEPVGAGTYLVVASFDPALAPNYVALPAMGLLTIDKAPAGVSFGALGPFTYDGAPKPVAPLNPNGVALGLAYAGTDGTVYGPSAVPPVGVGSYQATATIADPNYAQPPVTSGTFRVEPAGVTVSFGNLNQVYDGTTKAVVVTTVPGGVAVDVAYAQGGVPGTPVAAGTYEVTGTVVDPNYVLDAPAVASLTIAKATAQVTLSDLTQLYDGTPRPITVATQPLPFAVDVTYDGAPTAPSAVGSYAVVATVVDANYAGSASGTLTVLAAAISDFEVVGAVAFSGTAGAALAGDLPTARVVDAQGNGVPGVSVVFQQVAGGSSGAGAGAPETVTTDADGEATVSGWLLPADAGETVMTARVSGLAGLPTLEFTATGEEVADIALLKTATQAEVMQGGVVDYTLTVSNAGPSNALAVELADVLPGVLDEASAQWACIAEGSASCNGVANGSGDVALTVSVPVGGTVTVLLSATVRTAAALGPFDNVAGVLLDSGTDGNVDNDQSIATVTVTPRPGAIFSDGFEGDDAAGAQRDAD